MALAASWGEIFTYRPQPNSNPLVAPALAFEQIAPAAPGPGHSEEHLTVSKLRILLIVANAVPMAVLLAIPVGKLFGAVDAEVDAAAAFGWFIYFVPLFASALSLWGVQYSRPGLTRRFVMIALPGSFLIALVSLFAFWTAPPGFIQAGIGMALLFGLNVLALWGPFKAHLESVRTGSVDSAGER